MLICHSGKLTITQIFLYLIWPPPFLALFCNRYWRVWTSCVISCVFYCLKYVRERCRVYYIRFPTEMVSSMGLFTEVIETATGELIKIKAVHTVPMSTLKAQVHNDRFPKPDTGSFWLKDKLREIHLQLLKSSISQRLSQIEKGFISFVAGEIVHSQELRCKLNWETLFNCIETLTSAELSYIIKLILWSKSNCLSSCFQLGHRSKLGL